MEHPGYLAVPKQVRYLLLLKNLVVLALPTGPDLLL